MVAVSALAHVVALAAIVLVGARGGASPLPLVAYTVELTDPNALGGRVPPGPPAANLSGGLAHPPAPESKGEAPEPPAKPPPETQPEAKAEPKPPAPAEEPAVRLPDKPKPPEPKPEPKKPEPPKAEPKPEPKKPEPPKAVEKPEPPKPPATKVEPTPSASATPAKPAEAKSETRSGSPAGTESAPPRDAYAAAAERWRTKAGGGLGGADEGSGPIGSGGPGRGGGGELAGLEFIAYRQQVINTVKTSWTNVIGRPGLVAVVTFEIAPDGQVTNARLTQSSGNPAYDASALRAVQHTSRLPPPPARYVNDFREFIMRFNSEDIGGQGAG
jgi:colicin import membrane protein